MKKIFLFLFFSNLVYSNCFAQSDTIAFYKKSELMIPMRDGIKLHTVVFSPVDAKEKVPVLLQRTPYGAGPGGVANDSAISLSMFGSNSGGMLREGYFLVIQDIRGKYLSEGTMEIHQPLIHATEKNAVDESTDTSDTVNWLVKNLKDNNGNILIFSVFFS